MMGWGYTEIRIINWRKRMEEEGSKFQRLKSEQQKFRNLQEDRKIFVEESLATIKGQKATIDKLRKENEALKDMITQMTGEQNLMGVTGEIDAIDGLKSRIKEEKILQEKKDSHVKVFQEKIIDKKMDLGGHNAGAENENTLQRQIKILENRLDKANQKFNEAISVNKQLRQVIDSLRRERVIFDNLYKKLEKELYAKRKEMANIIERANTAYEDRDKSNIEINNLKMQAKKETTEFERELKELSHTLEKTKLTDCIRTVDKPKEEVMKNEPTQSIKSAKNYKMANIKSAAISEQVKNHQQDLAKIEAATGIKNFEDLVRIFEENEEKNFEMFKYVNMQSNEIEEIEKQIADLEAEINTYEGQASEVDQDKKIYLKRLEAKCSVSENNVKKFESHYNESLKILKSLTGWIQNLFNTAECDKAVAKELAGSTNISDSNTMIFLGIIEQRIVKIIKAYRDITAKESQIKDIISKAEKAPEKGKRFMEMPPYDELNDEEADGEKILTIEDFKKKANDTITRDQEKLKRKDPKTKKK